MKVRTNLWLAESKEQDEVTSIDILAEDGRDLFSIRMESDGTILIHAGSVCKHQGEILDDRLQVAPVGGNAVRLIRPIY